MARAKFSGARKRKERHIRQQALAFSPKFLIGPKNWKPQPDSRPRTAIETDEDFSNKLPMEGQDE